MAWDRLVRHLYLGLDWLSQNDARLYHELDISTGDVFLCLE